MSIKDLLLLLLQMFLNTRVRGPVLASHGVYHSLEYFKGVTGIRDADLLVCRKTETYVSILVPLWMSAVKRTHTLQCLLHRFVSARPLTH